MDVFEAIQKRNYSRTHESKSISKETLEKLLEAARLSPSAKNIQPWHFIVVTDPDKRKTLSKGLDIKFLSETPAVIVLCGDEKASPDWYVIDVALAGENMVIAATSEGLGTCWVGSFDEGEVKALLEIPRDLRVVAIMALGYTKEKTSIKSKVIQFIRRRKTLNEITSWEVYGQKLKVK